MNTLILIPVFNEGKKFPVLLKQVREFISPSDILVVDDGSTDDCCLGLENAGVKIIRHPANQGKGAALKTGFAYALQKDYGWILTMDADGQHDPACIPRFLEAVQRTNAGITAGSRRKSLKTMPLDRRFSNLTTSWILSVISGQKVLDAQCGYRLYSADFLRKITLKTSNFDTENELLLKAFRTKAKIAWVNIPTIYGSEKSHIRRFSDTYKFLSLLLKYIFRMGF